MTLDAGADLRTALRGPIVPLITPFDEALAIDWPAFDRHVEWLMARGIGVLAPADLVGESWALSLEEKAALIQRAVQVAAGRALVVAKLSEPALGSAAALAIAAREAGAVAVKVVLPPSVGADEAGAYDYLRTAGRQAGLPFLVETNGGEVALSVLDRLAEDGDLVGIEETSRDLDRFQLLVERYGERLAVIGGSEDVLGFTLLLGAAGFMTASPNFAPDFMGSLWQAAAAGEAGTVLRLYGRLRRYRRLFAAELAAGRPMFVPYTKAALELLGQPVGPPRPPLHRLTRSALDALVEVLRTELGLELA